MFPACRIAKLFVTPRPIAAVLLVAVVGSFSGAHAQGTCSSRGLAMMTSPMVPWRGAPLKVVFAADEPIAGTLTLTGPNGKVAAESSDQKGGPPYFWVAEVDKPAAGTWRAELSRQGAPAGCADVVKPVKVLAGQPAGPRRGTDSLWPVRSGWTRANENLYSVWVQTLFDAPLDEQPEWTSLHELLRDPKRNLLYNSLGLREDQQGLIIQPDCADLPYFLRAYFAFKMELPYGYAKCSRGGSSTPPRCPQWWSIEHLEPPPAPPEPQPVQMANGPFGMFREAPPPPVQAAPKYPPMPAGLVPGFGYYLRMSIANGVQSGNGRTSLDDSKSDFYPVPLAETSLTPGTIYADPYGHILVLARRIPQSADAPGMFLAVDAQPDGTVARKRYWQGNFLFVDNPKIGGPGFKHFRPIERASNGSLYRLSNAEIEKNADYGDVSLEQSKLSVEEFYDRMDQVMSPKPLDPKVALEDVVSSLQEQVETRVTSVENGRKYQKGGAVAAMPDGPEIFETSGAWEDYATPSRDMRLLIAIDVVKNFPAKVAAHPERYAVPQGESPEALKAALDEILAAELQKRQFTYTRSDGSEWTLTLKDVFERSPSLEMAYNVNDCVELRWGAPEGSEEAATCRRRAPTEQRSKMAEYRSWFESRTRPPRG